MAFTRSGVRLPLAPPNPSIKILQLNNLFRWLGSLPTLFPTLMQSPSAQDGNKAHSCTSISIPSLLEELSAPSQPRTTPLTVLTLGHSLK
jgi:hypothetical protein